MKKSIFVVITLLLCFGLSACSGKSGINVSEVDGLTIEVKQDTVSNTSLSYIVYNQTEHSISTGAWYAIERKHNNTWYNVSYANGTYIASWDAVAYGFTGEQGEFDCDWEYLYGSLEPGEYRLIKQFSFENEDGSVSQNQKYYISGEFTIE